MMFLFSFLCFQALDCALDLTFSRFPLQNTYVPTLAGSGVHSCPKYSLHMGELASSFVMIAGMIRKQQKRRTMVGL